jgi:hypothetical protein
MTLRRLIILAALVGAMAGSVVVERARITQAGYRISRLSADEVKLTEQLRVHKVYVTRLRQPEFIRRHIVRLGLQEGTREVPTRPSEREVPALHDAVADASHARGR